MIWISTFLFGAAAYPALEIAVSGHTHWTMMLAGGGCLCALRALAGTRLPFWGRVLCGGAIITAAELCIGIVCNLWLNWRVWDYSREWGNIAGQICPRFSAYWLLLSLPLTAFFDWEMRCASQRGSIIRRKKSR